MTTHRPAVIASDGTFTYDELDLASRRVAAALLGGRRDLEQDRVAFLAPPTFAYVAVQRGIWRAGGVAVPLAVSYPPAELEYVIRDSGAQTLVAHPTFAGTAAPVAHATGARYLMTSDALATPALESTPHIGSPRRAMIVYTSGTTGRPKGAVTTHANIGAQIASLVSAWGWRTTDRLLLVLPLHHVHGIINVLGCALASGASCEILPQFETEPAWERLASGDVTVFSAVPTIYHRLIQSWDAAPAAVRRARSDGCRNVRLMMSGSAALPVRTLERWREITGHTLLERYGMTEIGMALSNPLHGERRPGFVGAALPGVDVRLVDSEIEVRGPGVFLEYWRRPGETRDAFHDGWFRTGDVAAIEGGSYRILGRQSIDIIKTGGFKVSALEIEEVIRAHPAVLDCAVVGLPDSEWGERVSIAVELEPGAALSLEELQAWTKPRLAPYKIPKVLRCVPALPRNAMGKVVKPEVATLLTP
jgi:malonyl-CoA/methylmalonyl-CoA synthetase